MTRAVASVVFALSLVACEDARRPAGGDASVLECPDVEGISARILDITAIDQRGVLRPLTATMTDGSRVVAGTNPGDPATAGPVDVPSGSFVGTVGDGGLAVVTPIASVEAEFFTPFGDTHIAAAGNIDALAEIGGEVRRPEGGTDVWVGAWSNSGATSWVQVFGNIVDEAVLGLGASEDRVYAAVLATFGSLQIGDRVTASPGRFARTLVVAFDSAGELVWLRWVNQVGQGYVGLSPQPDGTLHVAYRDSDVESGDPVLAIERWDENGDMTSRVDGPVIEGLAAFASDADGHVAFARVDGLDEDYELFAIDASGGVSWRGLGGSGPVAPGALALDATSVYVGFSTSPGILAPFPEDTFELTPALGVFDRTDGSVRWAWRAIEGVTSIWRLVPAGDELGVLATQRDPIVSRCVDPIATDGVIIRMSSR